MCALPRLEESGKRQNVVKNFARGMLGPYVECFNSLSFWCVLHARMTLLGLEVSRIGHTETRKGGSTETKAPLVLEHMLEPLR